MSGRFSKVAANPRSAASAARSLPGSVMTAKRAGSGWRSHAQARWLRVSSVEPDLDAATCRVRSGGSSRAEAGDGGRIGGVEHVQHGRRRIGAAAAGHHLGEQARPAHARQQHVVDATRQPRAPGGSHVECRPTISATTDSQPRRSAISVGIVAPQCVVGPQVRATASRAARSSSASAAGLGEGSEPIGRVVEDHRRTRREARTDLSDLRAGNGTVLVVRWRRSLTSVTCYQPRPAPAPHLRAESVRSGRTGVVRSRARDRCRSTLAGPWRRQPVSVPTRPASPPCR